MTDLGMTGPHDSVIGVRAEAAVQRFLTSMRTGFSPADEDLRIQGALVISDDAGRAQSIQAINLMVEAPE
jgi:calcineurin-like phosphoesterase